MANKDWTGRVASKLERIFKMTHNFNRDNDYLIQLPYLNEMGNARVIGIQYYEASQLVESGSHKLLKADSHLYVLTPIKAAVVNHIFQVGELAV